MNRRIVFIHGVEPALMLSLLKNSQILQMKADFSRITLRLCASALAFSVNVLVCLPFAKNGPANAHMGGSFSDGQWVVVGHAHGKG